MYHSATHASFPLVLDTMYTQHGMGLVENSMEMSAALDRGLTIEHETNDNIIHPSTFTVGSAFVKAQQVGKSEAAIVNGSVVSGTADLIEDYLERSSGESDYRRHVRLRDGAVQFVSHP